MVCWIYDWTRLCVTIWAATKSRYYNTSTIFTSFSSTVASRLDRVVEEWSFLARSFKVTKNITKRRTVRPHIWSKKRAICSSQIAPSYSELPTEIGVLSYQQPARGARCLYPFLNCSASLALQLLKIWLCDLLYFSNGYFSVLSESNAHYRTYFSWKRFQTTRRHFYRSFTFLITLGLHSIVFYHNKYSLNFPFSSVIHHTLLALPS